MRLCRCLIGGILLGLGISGAFFIAAMWFGIEQEF